jgi:hypothetical protein
MEASLDARSLFTEAMDENWQSCRFDLAEWLEVTANEKVGTALGSIPTVRQSEIRGATEKAALG